MSENVIGKGKYDIQVIYDGSDITELTQSVEWSGEVNKCARTLRLKLINLNPDRSEALINFEHGKEVRFLNFEKELFRGVLFSTDINNKGEMSVTCFEESIYLNKSYDDRIFESVKASDIFKRLCNDFSVPVGEVADTGYVLPRKIYANKTLYQMIYGALEETRKQTGRRFVIGNKDGKVTLTEPKEQLTKWVIEEGSNVLSASYSQSINDLKSQVKVVGGDKENELVSVKSDEELASNFGVMQHFERMSGEPTKSEVAQRAKELLDQLGTIDDNADIEALGIDEVIAGKSIYAKESTTQIMGGYYVISDTHTFDSNGGHTMRLDLSATDELPKLIHETKIKH